MDQTGKRASRLRFQMLLALLLHFVEETRSSYEEYELIAHYNFTWTSALNDSPDNPLANITNVVQLCDGQAQLLKSSSTYCWTALRVNSRGSFEMGLLPYNSAQIHSELLDKREPWDRCYAIGRSDLKLKSMNCSRKLPYLTSYKVTDDPLRSENHFYPDYSDQCRQYLLSKCVRKGTRSGRQASEYSWSCEEPDGIMVGSCQIEDTLLNCCQTYCREGNYIYTLEMGSGLDAKVRKVPEGVSTDVEISFYINNNGSESKLAQVIITHKVFKHAGRAIAVLLHRKAQNEASLWTYNGSNYTLISDVVGVVLDPPQNETIQDKITIYFSHKELNIDPKIVERQCVFWMEDFNSTNGGSWSSDGCTVLSDSSMLSTVCSCNHLTNFAVLMQYKDIEEGNIPPEHRKALLIITYVGCSLSLVGEVLVIFVYVTFMKRFIRNRSTKIGTNIFAFLKLRKIKAEGIQVRLNLSTALFLAQLVFLSGIDATSNKSVCILVAVLLHYFYLGAFGWMLLEGVFLYIMIVEVFNTVNMRYLYFFGWGFPIVPIVISLIIGSSGEKGLDTYTNENFCWLSFHKRLSWAFIVPVLLVTVINFGILMAVLREIRNLHELNPSKMKTFRKTLKSFIILSPLLGLTWIFGLLAVTDAGLEFQYVFTILNSTQGMLIFLLLVLRNSEVRAAFHHKMLKWRFNI